MTSTDQCRDCPVNIVTGHTVRCPQKAQEVRKCHCQDRHRFGQEGWRAQAKGRQGEVLLENHRHLCFGKLTKMHSIGCRKHFKDHLIGDSMRNGTILNKKIMKTRGFCGEFRLRAEQISKHFLLFYCQFYMLYNGQVFLALKKFNAGCRTLSPFWSGQRSKKWT